VSPPFQAEAWVLAMTPRRQGPDPEGTGDRTGLAPRSEPFACTSSLLGRRSGRVAKGVAPAEAETAPRTSTEVAVRWNPRAGPKPELGFTRTEPMSGVHVKERFRRIVSR
jgi:hypothetical protein